MEGYGWWGLGVEQVAECKSYPDLQMGVLLMHGFAVVHGEGVWSGDSHSGSISS